MTTTCISKDEMDRYEVLVRDCFGFLESLGHMNYCGVRIAGGSDPRDQSIVVRYCCEDCRVDIGWNAVEGALVILLRFERDDLAGNDRYVYLEPFIEFLTHGEMKALVPYVREGMSIRQLQAVMEDRERTFENGLGTVIAALARRVEPIWLKVVSASSQTVMEYHKWIKRKG